MSYIQLDKNNLKKLHTKVYRIVDDKVEVGRITRDGKFIKDFGGELKANLSELFYKIPEERIWDIVLEYDVDLDIEEFVEYDYTYSHENFYKGNWIRNTQAIPQSRRVYWEVNNKIIKDKEELIKIIKNEK